MSGAMEPLKYLPAFTDLTVKLSHQPILGVFIGTIITMLVQASSATISILQNVYQENLITLKAALPVLFGDNIGTTITAIIAVIGANTSAKRLALSHTMFNVIGTAIFLILLSPFSIFVEKMAQILHLNPKVTIAFAHGSFNVMTTILLFPFIGLLEYIVVKVIKEKDEDKVEHKPKYLDSALISAPSIALGQVKQEMLSMISITLKSLERSVKFFHNHDEKDAERVEKSEDAINNIDQEITKYLTTLSQEHITEKDGEEISMYLDMCRDVERIGDHAIGIVRDVRYEIKKKVVFTDVAHQEIEKLFRISKRIIETAEEALKNDDTEKAFAVVDLHNKLYAKEKEVRKAHIKRVSKQQCDVKAGLYYIDVVSHFTRIGDHARNLVEKMIENNIK